MDDRIVLVFDVGTQSARAMLIDSSGKMVGFERKRYDFPYFSPEPDWAEQDADFYYEAISGCALRLKERMPEEWKRIEAVSISTIRDTIVCVDRNGKPLRPAILWLDKRVASGNPVLNPGSAAALKLVGMTETTVTQFRKSHVNWIRENEPEIWEKTYKCLLLSAYLVYRLTGVMADAAASMVGHLPIDSKKRCWLGKNALIYPVFPVEPEKLCEVKDTGEIFGNITEKCSSETGVPAGLPVIATGSDRACEILGLGCVDKHQAAIGLGTTATVTYMSQTYLEPERFIPPYPAVVPGCWNPEVEIFRGYWLVEWFKKEFAHKEVIEASRENVTPEEMMNRRLKDIPAGCEGLMFQPYFTPNITMPTARGALIGFSDCHTRAHIYRAIIEGINFALMDGMRMIEKRAGHQMDSVYLGGGGSQSDEICQITADMFGIPVFRTETTETTGIGCAVATFVALGVFPDYRTGISRMVRIKDHFEPDMKIHEIYNTLYEDVFSKTYGRLKPLYHKLSDIYRRS